MANNEIQFFDKLKNFLYNITHTVHEEKKRSHQGGHYKIRISHDPNTDITVEEIELFCDTLDIDKIIKKEKNKHK